MMTSMVYRYRFTVKTKDTAKCCETCKMKTNTDEENENEKFKKRKKKIKNKIFYNKYSKYFQ